MVSSLFLPTAAFGQQGPYSMFPDTLDPRLVLTAYTGDLGLDSGLSQSVFTLDKSQMTQVRQGGRPLTKSLAIGETMRLPGGQGSLTFDRVARFANFQIAYDPGKEISLVAAIMLLLGLTISLVIRRRRMWVRVASAPAGEPATLVEIAAHSLSRREAPRSEIATLAKTLGSPTQHDTAPALGASTDPSKDTS